MQAPSRGTALNLDRAAAAHILSGFACPDSPNNCAAAIAQLDGCAVIRRILEMHDTGLAQGFPGLAPILRDWIGDLGHALWHPSVGRLRALAPSSKPCDLPMLVEIGFMANLDGAAGRWSFRLGEATTIWIGRWICPGVHAGHVEATDRLVVARFDFADGSQDTLRLEGFDEKSGWLANRLPRRTIELPVVALGPDAQIVLVPGGELPGDMVESYPGAAFEPQARFPTIARAFERAGQIFRIGAPAYLDWVAGAVGYVVPTVAPDGMQGSSSDRRHSGLVVVSSDRRPMGLAEMLVHEASHQRFHIAERLGQVDDGSDDGLYYSSLARRERPIDRILLAFHALGNIVLLYRHCLASGVDDGGYCAAHMDDALDALRQLDSVLLRTNALTEIGLALWRPLTARIGLS